MADAKLIDGNALAQRLRVAMRERAERLREAGIQPGLAVIVVGEPLLHPHDTNIVAVASDARVDTRLPQFLLDDIAAIADFIEQHARPA